MGHIWATRSLEKLTTEAEAMRICLLVLLHVYVNGALDPSTRYPPRLWYESLLGPIRSHASSAQTVLAFMLASATSPTFMCRRRCRLRTVDQQGAQVHVAVSAPGPITTAWVMTGYGR